MRDATGSSAPRRGSSSRSASSSPPRDARRGGSYGAGLLAYDLLARRRSPPPPRRDLEVLAPHVRRGPDRGLPVRRRADRRRAARPARASTRPLPGRSSSTTRPPRSCCSRRRRACSASARPTRGPGGARRRPRSGAAVVNATGAWADRLRAPWAAPPACGRCAAATSSSRPGASPWRRRSASRTRSTAGRSSPSRGRGHACRHDRPRPRGRLDAEPDQPGRGGLPRDGGAPRLPGARPADADALASFAGVRPVIGTGRPTRRTSRATTPPGGAGLLTVTGGKLTTFARSPSMPSPDPPTLRRADADAAAASTRRRRRSTAARRLDAAVRGGAGREVRGRLRRLGRGCRGVRDLRRPAAPPPGRHGAAARRSSEAAADPTSWRRSREPRTSGPSSAGRRAPRGSSTSTTSSCGG